MTFQMGRRSGIRLSLLAGAAALTVALGAHFATAEQDKVVARVDGAPITERMLELAEGDIGQAMGSLPPQAKQDYLTSFAIDLQILARAAEKQGVGNTDAFKGRLAYLRDKALMETFLEREIAQSVTDGAVKAFYDEQIAQAPKETEVKARHILVESEDEAKAIIAELKKGADFTQLAKEKTQDPSGKEDGGDLGFFTKEQMVPEFSEAAFALQPGQLAEQPVKSQFGWHIIKLEEKREKQPPALAEIEDRVRAYLSRKTQSDILTKLRGEAKIDRVAGPAPAAPNNDAQKAPVEQPKAQ
jgi:peptidyl-prolyl cis-trans isomerase C